MNEEKKNYAAVAANEDANFLEGASNNNNLNEEADVSSVENSKYEYIPKVPFDQRQYGVAYDGLDWFSDYFPIFGDYREYESYLDHLYRYGHVSVLMNMEKDLPSILCNIYVALGKIELMRGLGWGAVHFGDGDYILVRLRHINNIYPPHYFTINIPEIQAEVLVCFHTETAKQEFIKKQTTYFNGKTFEETICEFQEEYVEQAREKIIHDEEVKKFAEEINYITENISCIDRINIDKDNPLRVRMKDPRFYDIYIVYREQAIMSLQHK